MQCRPETERFNSNFTVKAFPVYAALFPVSLHLREKLDGVCRFHWKCFWSPAYCCNHKDVFGDRFGNIYFFSQQWKISITRFGRLGLLQLFPSYCHHHPATSWGITITTGGSQIVTMQAPKPVWLLIHPICIVTMIVTCHLANKLMIFGFDYMSAKLQKSTGKIVLCPDLWKHFPDDFGQEDYMGYSHWLMTFQPQVFCFVWKRSTWGSITKH